MSVLCNQQLMTNKRNIFSKQSRMDPLEQTLPELPILDINLISDRDLRWIASRYGVSSFKQTSDGSARKSKLALFNELNSISANPSIPKVSPRTSKAKREEVLYFIRDNNLEDALMEYVRQQHDPTLSSLSQLHRNDLCSFLLELLKSKRTMRELYEQFSKMLSPFIKCKTTTSIEPSNEVPEEEEEFYSLEGEDQLPDWAREELLSPPIQNRRTSFSRNTTPAVSRRTSPSVSRRTSPSASRRTSPSASRRTSLSVDNQQQMRAFETLQELLEANTSEIFDEYDYVYEPELSQFVEIKESLLPEAGQGLFVTAPFHKNQVITLYGGERLTENQRTERDNTYVWGPPQHDDVLQLKKPYWDAINETSPYALGKYANDPYGKDDRELKKQDTEGFQPNATIIFPSEKLGYVVKNIPKITTPLVVATRYIEPNEEIFVDYGDEFWEEY